MKMIRMIISYIYIFLVANTTTTTAAASGAATTTAATTTTTITPSSALKKKVNVEKEHSKSMLQHVKNIRSEKQLNQMLGTLSRVIHSMDEWIDRWIDALIDACIDVHGWVEIIFVENECD
jgi:hypothetical protein